jgi:signal peptidase I
MPDPNPGSYPRSLLKPASSALTPEELLAAAKKARKQAQPTPESKDGVRELVECVVFVVVLVLLLKSFVAEAFVIPTGSMAETLLGYQKNVVCPECKYEFPVNCSQEVDPQQSKHIPVTGAWCPNCRKHIVFSEQGVNPPWYTGDRVLVAKFLYDLNLLGMNHPDRDDVVVFKYPKEPQRDYVAMNYIKRLIGLPGETIAVYYGKLYHRNDITYDDDKSHPLDMWKPEFTHRDESVELFMQDEGKEPRDRKFKILRKAPDKILSKRRLVYDNDHQATDLISKIPPRWQFAVSSSWKSDDPRIPKRFEATGGDETTSWLRYQHLVPRDDRSGARVELITDFMGYNTWEPEHLRPAENWVGDLMLECEVQVNAPQGQLVFELSRGPDRFHAIWDLTTGKCTLSRLSDGREEDLGTQDTLLKRAGKYRIRFANVDERLMLWVDSSQPFGNGVVYDPPRQRGPTKNDLEPASIGVKGNASLAVSSLKLWRDTYYTVIIGSNTPDAGQPVDLSMPDSWKPLQDIRPLTMYVQPGHFLCMGDNSPESSDGRSWGLVPERLLLGRAMLVYWPYWRAGIIH